MRGKSQTAWELSETFCCGRRFLRRLELGLRKKETVPSPSDSFESGEDSPRVTSPLLQSPKEPRIEIRKSRMGKMQKGRLQRGELLRDRVMKVSISGYGLSD